MLKVLGVFGALAAGFVTGLVVSLVVLLNMSGKASR